MTDTDNKDPQITVAQIERVVNWLKSRPQAAWYISEQDYDAAINTWASRGTELIPIIEQLPTELSQLEVKLVEAVNACDDYGMQLHKLRAERAGLIEWVEQQIKDWCKYGYTKDNVPVLNRLKSKLTDSAQRGKEG